MPPENLASNAEAREYVVLQFAALLNSADVSLFCATLADQEVYRGRRIIVVDNSFAECNRKNVFRGAITGMTI